VAALHFFYEALGALQQQAPGPVYSSGETFVLTDSHALSEKGVIMAKLRDRAFSSDCKIVDARFERREHVGDDDFRSQFRDSESGQ
jgi:hypothetical protein